jgi:SAM-dependent methyltransferase
VLDVGSGRNPTVLREARPPGTRYVGLDLSRNELRLAGPGAYDDVVVADLATRVESLVGSVDLALSWQVFEHVTPLAQAFDNLHAYLRPGGTLISFFSGRWSMFGIVNQLLPNALGRRLVEMTMRRRGTDHPVFPAYYDRCAFGAIQQMLGSWTEVEITSFFRGATYFHFSRILTRAYLSYENVIYRARLNDLATHYLLVARR